MPNPILTDAVERLLSGVDLGLEEAASVLESIMAGEASEVQAAGFLVALRAKGETAEELAGLATTMRRRALAVQVEGDDLLDTAGTGGGRPSSNVSTAAAFVAAGAGCRVAKHGNRSATSRSGSADVLEALGARIDLGPEAVAECVEAVGFGFMFAPAHHAAMRHVGPVRRELGVRTVFNFLGPLTNPAGATRQLIGVSDPAVLARMAEALGTLGGVRALVVSGEDGFDEVSASGATRVVELADGTTRAYRVVPEELGVERVASGEIHGGSPADNADTLRAVLSGRGASEQALVLVNAGAAIYVAGRAPSLAAGVRAAREAISSGAAEAVLQAFVERTRRLAPAP